MDSARRTTRFAAWGPGPARALLALTAAAVGWCVFVALTRTTLSTPGSGEADSDGHLYRRIVERVHGGEGYYEAAGDELRTRGYPTGAVFNWRPPVYAWVIGKLPEPVWAQVVLVLAAAAALLLAYTAVERRAGVGPAAAAAVALVPALGWALLGNVFLFTELWA